MTRIAAIFCLMAICLGSGASAGEVKFSVRHEAEALRGLSVALPLPIPFRVAVIDGPPRLVLDMRLEDADLPVPEGVALGAVGDGWTRAILPLNGPMAVEAAGYDGAGRLNVTLRPATEAEFRTATADGVPWPLPEPETAPILTAAPLILVDPGHGGVDPGAIRKGVAEKDIALAFAHVLAERLRADGRFEVALTRGNDRFLTLTQRVGMARSLSPRLFLSLHANTVTRGDASGVVVYTRGATPSDPASAALAALENAADAIGGQALGRLEADIEHVLMDMAEPVTRKRAGDAADALVARLAAEGHAIRSRPLRSADFRVLSAPDVPSLLIELGFLSDAQDLADLQSAAWRQDMAGLILEAVAAWYEDAGREASLPAR